MTHTVIGGGLTGLVAAIALTKRGRQVQLIERSSHLGGRAISQIEDGFTFNFGPHALYKNGLTYRTLREWGLELAGGSPQLSANSYAVADGQLFALPVGAGSLFRCGYLNAFEKFDFGNAYRKLTGLSATDAAGQTVAEWIDAKVRTEKARAMLLTLVRLSTYANLPEHLSLAATVPQFALSAGGVAYLDGGWQKMIDDLVALATSLGVQIRTGEPSTALSTTSPTILAIPPRDIEKMTGVTLPERKPLRMACLDLGMDGLPDGAALFALGVDQPVYLSVHSQWARLAPTGQFVVHLGKYLTTPELYARAELEEFADVTMPGWRSRVKAERFMAGMVVSHALPEVAGRIPVDVLLSRPGFENVRVAGDWVGSDGMLADACTASALRCAEELA